MKTYFNLIIIVIVTFNLFSCKDDPVTPPPPPVTKDTINISVSDITHRSISIDIKISPKNLNSTVRLYRLLNSTETIVSEFPITTKDTTIIDDGDGAGLLLNTGYLYYALRVDSTGTKQDSSNFVQAITLDTTSHNYTWQEFFFGNGMNDRIYDVWGTDENNVWAVGGVFINNKFYGGFHWNGNEWLLDSIVGGEAIWGFAENDIWVVGGAVFHYEGADWINYILLDSILRQHRPYTSIWGTSSSNLYLGNIYGKVIHWDGTQAKVILELEQYVTDIHGSSADNICVVANSFQLTLPVLAFFNGSEWNIQTVPWAYGPITVYVYNKSNIYIGGDGFYFRKNNEWEDMGVNISTPIYNLRGVNTNDIFAVGANGSAYHYNGSTWKRFNELPITGFESYTGVFNTGSKVFIVGYSGSRGKILIGSKH